VVKKLFPRTRELFGRNVRKCRWEKIREIFNLHSGSMGLILIKRSLKVSVYEYYTYSMRKEVVSGRWRIFGSGFRSRESNMPFYCQTNFSVFTWNSLNPIIVVKVISTHAVHTVLYDVMHLRSQIFSHMLLGSADECVTHVPAIVCRRMCSETE
jgi:hypothetical protein